MLILLFTIPLLVWNLNTGRTLGGGAGDKNSGLVAGGYATTAKTAGTEEYNGTSWAEQNDLNTAGYDMGSAGTQTAGLAIGGYVSGDDAIAIVEEYNGTAWTATECYKYW